MRNETKSALQNIMEGVDFMGKSGSTFPRKHYPDRVFTYFSASSFLAQDLLALVGRLGS